MSPTFADILAAQERIRPHVVRTPVLGSEELDAACGGRLFFKCENLQAAGAFKSRGACNAVFALPDAVAARGVVTHSSGNHAAAVARAARLRGIAALVVMPTNAARSKVRNVEAFGGRITWCEPNLAARERACAEIAAATGATLVHPFDDDLVIAGQGTAALELMEAEPDLDAILCPVGGGGLLAGTAIAAKTGPGRHPRVIGVEPAVADDVAQSFRARRRVSITHAPTVADGLRTNCTGERNLPLILAHVDDVVTVPEEAIVRAMRRLWETLRVVVEPSSAVPFAAVLEGIVPAQGKRLGIIVSGGNVDLDSLPWNTP